MVFLWIIFGPDNFATPKIFKNKMALLAGITAFLLFIPHLIWQAINKWPTLEFIQNATSQKVAAISPLEFLIDQIILLHPTTFPLWGCGILYYFFYKDGRKYRILGIIYIVVLLLLIINEKSRPAYLAPAYTMLFASVALVFERFFSWTKWKWL